MPVAVASLHARRRAMGTNIGGVPINPGTRFVVDEEDYLYGAGEVRIIVREVLAVFEHSSTDWVELRVGQIMADGSTIPREITVRLSALRARSAA
jgi:hypothetical protein